MVGNTFSFAIEVAVLFASQLFCWKTMRINLLQFASNPDAIPCPWSMWSSATTSRGSKTQSLEWCPLSWEVRKLNVLGGYLRVEHPCPELSCGDSLASDQDRAPMHSFREGEDKATLLRLRR